MEQGGSRRTDRRFGLGDGLILLAALALTLAVLRANDWFGRFPGRLANWWRLTLELLGAKPWSAYGLTTAQVWHDLAVQVANEILVQFLSSVLLGLTLAQPVLRLRRPRPPLQDVIRQPGLAVCLALILGTIAAVDLWWMIGTDVIAWIGPVLPLALLWPLLGIFPWRPEPSWIDRLGRAVGWGWVIAIVSGMAIYFLA
jgi:hypothetical protein